MNEAVTIEKSHEEISMECIDYSHDLAEENFDEFVKSVEEDDEADVGSAVYSLWVSCNHFLAGEGLTARELKKVLTHHHKVARDTYGTIAGTIALAAQLHNYLTFRAEKEGVRNEFVRAEDLFSLMAHNRPVIECTFSIS